HEGKQQGFLYSVENAIVTPHTGPAPRRAAGHGSPIGGQTDHQKQNAKPLKPVATADLVAEIAELIGRKPERPIEIEPVSPETFGDLIRNQLKATYPEETRAARTEAFSLLGILPKGADWIETITQSELAWCVALSNETGDRIQLLDRVPVDHPYVRLQLVGKVAEALTRQSFAENGANLSNDDARRAHDGLYDGIRISTIYRYSRSRGISPSAPPPEEFRAQTEERTFGSVELDPWQSLPEQVGPFFVEFIVGANGALSKVDPAFAKPPSTTMELFRPRWYQDPSLWRQDPVPADFSNDILETPPILTDVFGVGGIVPWLATMYPIDSAKSLAGQWAGDRWAIWKLPDDGFALLFEIRFQNEESAREFREAIPNHPFQHIPEHQDGSSSVQILRGSSSAAIERLSSGLSAAP
ncbi:MAG: hypothetical protein AAF585_05760, partial [Verrucomicrobiota bacterium]